MVPTSKRILYHFSTHILVVFFGEDTTSNLYADESIKYMMFDIANEFMWMF